LANGNGKRIEPEKNNKTNKEPGQEEEKKTWLNKNWIMETW
jgi:hypothetical protein